MTFAGQKLVPPLASPMMPQSFLIRSLLRRRFPGRLIGGALSCDGRQARQLAGWVTVRTADAVGLIELDGQLQGLVPFGHRRRGVLAAHRDRTHRHAEHRPGPAVAVDGLDPGVAAMTPRQLDDLFGGPPQGHGVIELLPAHPISTPDTGTQQRPTRSL